MQDINSHTALLLQNYMLQSHLHLLSSGVHQLSDKVYGCRFSTHMDLLCTETYTNTKEMSTAEDTSGKVKDKIIESTREKLTEKSRAAKR